MRTSQLAVSAVAMLWAVAASAQDRAPGWLKRPSLQDLRTVWPLKALKEGYGGNATIRCIVTVQGALRQCQVLSETPAGGGFGGAGLALATQFLMKPALKGGTPVESVVQIPITFPEPGKALGSLLQPNTANAIGERIYTRMPWRQAPTYAEMLAAYPAKARAAKVGGTAVLDCKLKDGAISACRTLQETPSGQGFGAAAKTLAPHFLTITADSKGVPLAPGRVQLPIVFPAAALEAGAPAIGMPQFTAMPQFSDFKAAFPAAARKAQVYKARVVMSCAIAAEGALQGCTVASEDPAGLGYGEAALRLSAYFRVGVWTDEGLPTVGGVIRLPLRFDMDATTPPKP